jgi:hypothetical protein
MTVVELARVANECRQAQVRYFYSRSNSALEEAQRQERKLDRCIAWVLEGNRDLFEDSPQA